MIGTERQTDEVSPLVPLNIWVGFSTPRRPKRARVHGRGRALSILFEVSGLSLISARIGIEREREEYVVPEDSAVMYGVATRPQNNPMVPCLSRARFKVIDMKQEFNTLRFRNVANTSGKTGAVLWITYHCMYRDRLKGGH